jgi:hypothetical protein
MGMKHEIEHGLSPELARKAVDKAMEAYSTRFAEFNPEFHWVSEDHGKLGFRAKGVSVKGDVEIVGPKILVDLEVPFLLRVFKGKAIEVIDREVHKWVEKARAGEI